MPFAQLVLGPPGSGKSTYCDGMHQFLSAIGRKCSVVNLDPANEQTSYPCALDVRDLLTVEEVMRDEALGPNGAVLYALEELEASWDWLAASLKELGGTFILQLRSGGAASGLQTDGRARGLRPVRLPWPGGAVYAPRLAPQHLPPHPEAWVQSPLFPSPVLTAIPAAAQAPSPAALQPPAVSAQKQATC